MKNMTISRVFLAVFVLGIGTLVAGRSTAQTAYPSKPLRLVIPFAAGGTTDLLGRIIGQALSVQVGQPVVLDNRGGAGGTLGAALVAKAPADGYTLILSNAASHGVAPSLHKKIPYDADRDFSHIGIVGLLPQFFVSNRSVAAANLKELIAEARRAPGKISYGSAGSGSIGNFSAELLKRLAGIEMVHVPYKGTAPATVDLIANRVQVMFQNAPEAAPHIRAGTLKLLAVTGERRSPQFPDAPTFVEEGVKLVNYTWYGLSAPAGTPGTAVAFLDQALTVVLGQPAIKARLAELGFETRRLSPQGYQQFVRSEVLKFVDVARKARIATEN